MKQIRIYPKLELAHTWAIDRTRYCPDATQPPMCLRCGRPLRPALLHNARSRYADVYICSDCGEEEAFHDWAKEPQPLHTWDAAVKGRLKRPADDDAWVLTPLCSFPQVFQNKDGLDCPASELAYSRSDYDGHKCWTSWFDCHVEHRTPERVREIDQFITALFQAPEFQTLDAMERMCWRYAERTKERTEYNLYAETDSFYIWLRPITRFKDYNLYVHFYVKQ